jgi:shikimate dehydrogenase
MISGTMIRGTTQLYGLVGRPVRRSASPGLHNAWFAHYGIDAVYLALEVPEGADGGVLLALRTLGVAGANVTVPLKRALLSQVDTLEPLAQAAGAVNTLVREGDRWVGANTDVEGYCRSLEEAGESLAGRDARILGTGGAARAVAVGLASRGARRVVVLGREPAKAQAIVDELAPRFPAVLFGTGPLVTEALRDADLCTVATSGRPPVLEQLDPRVLASRALWVDLNYWDPHPPGFSRAQAAGHRTLSGHAMLEWQARLAFSLWTGRLPDTLLSRPSRV